MKNDEIHHFVTPLRALMLRNVEIQKNHIYRLNALCAALSDFYIKTTNYLCSLRKSKFAPRSGENTGIITKQSQCDDIPTLRLQFFYLEFCMNCSKACGRGEDEATF